MLTMSYCKGIAVQNRREAALCSHATETENAVRCCDSVKNRLSLRECRLGFTCFL